MPILSLLRALFRSAPAAPPLSKEEAVAAARDLVQRAKQLPAHRDGGAEEHRLLFQATRLDPDNIEAKRLLARASLSSDAKTDRTEAYALPLLNELVALDPSNPEFLFMRGLAHGADLARDSARKALDDFAAVIRLDPAFEYGRPYGGPCAAFTERASIFESRLGDIARAIEELDQAIRHCPDYYWAYAFRARLRGKQGDINGAIADCSEAIRCKPDEFTYNARGEFYLKKDEFDLAIADFTAAIEIHPWHSPYIGRGEAHKRKGNLHAALGDFRRAGGHKGGPGRDGYLSVRALIARRRHKT